MRCVLLEGDPLTGDEDAIGMDSYQERRAISSDEHLVGVVTVDDDETPSAFEMFFNSDIDRGQEIGALIKIVA